MSRPPLGSGQAARLSVVLGQAQAEEARAAAWAAKQTLSEWIRQAVQERLDRSATTSEEAP